MKKGYLNPTIVIILALITLGVAATLIFNAKLFPKPKSSPQPSPSPITSPSPSPDASREPNGSAETADWKTYTDEISRYQISFPSNLETRKGEVEGEALLRAIPIGERNRFFEISFNSVENKETLHISTSVNYDSINYHFEPKLSAESLAEVSAIPAKISEANLGGKNVYKVDFDNSEQRIGSIVYWIFSYGSTSRSAIDIAVGVSNQNAMLVDQILSTFKFLD